MNEEQRRRLLTLVRELDQTVPSAPNSVKIGASCDEFHELEFLATEGGYLRLGVELLKAATVTPCEKQADGTFWLDCDTEAIFAQDSEARFAVFTLTDALPEPLPQAAPLAPTWRDKVNNALGFTFCMALLGTFLVGVVTIVFWIGEIFR